LEQQTGLPLPPSAPHVPGTGSACGFPLEQLNQSVPACFEKVAALYPSKTAVRGQGRDITYDSLNRTANRIAGSVSTLAGADHGRIALLFRHRPQALAAMLGVLKSGKAYIPLDPSYPRARTAYILEDSRADLILTEKETVGLAADLACGKCPVLDIDAIDSAFPDGKPGFAVAPEALAYIIYTSGSTGQPKGVMQTHCNLLHFIRSYSSGLSLSATDRLSLLPSFSFSASLMDIYGALLNGAAVCLYDVREEGSVALAKWLNEEQITIYHSVPTLFRHLVAGLSGAERFPRLRAIDLGGEPVFDRDVELFQRHFDRECILVNHLAFTEASVVARNFIHQNSPVPPGKILAGYPGDGVEVTIVDEDGQQAEVGQTGEIVLRSRYLSPGYWGQPDLTKVAFVQDPDGSGLRRYRSGDLGRIGRDGLLEHLGRKDFRVKIRGLTIEVAEIETCLLGLESIKEAVALAREERGGEQFLVAYVVAGKDVPPSEASLRDFLRHRLPDYMIPAEFVFVDALPLNPNGKVDRGALSLADSSRTKPTSSLLGPRNHMERRLADIWCKVLELDEVGVTDNFFDLGGHSLRAFQLFAEIGKVFEVRISPSVLLQAPTIELLARTVEAQIHDKGTATAVSLVPIRPDGSRLPLFCIAPIADSVLWFRELVDHIDPEYPVFCIESSDAVLSMTLEAMATRSIDIMRTVSPSGPFILIGYSSGGVVAFEAGRQLLDMDLPIQLLAMIDSPCPVPGGEEGGGKLAAIARACMNFPYWLYYYWRGTEHRAAQLNLVLRKALGLHVEETSDPFYIVGRYLQKISAWLNGYRVKPYRGRIAFYRARGQKLLRPLKLDEEWRKFAKHIDVYPVPGHHAQILKEPHVRVLADKINKELRDVGV